jgi:hypothetical protein
MQCSDCGVALVWELADAAASSDRSPERHRPELLWTGTDEGMAAHIESALDSAKISHHHRVRDSGDRPGWSQPVYAILIHARDHQAAHAALDDAIRRFEAAPDDTEDEPEASDSSPLIPAESDDEDDSLDVPQDFVPDDFDPAEATVEVWSGADATMRNNLVTFLGGIGIGSATDDSTGRLRILVTPLSQERALEMIRQVIAAT